jgi:hypothetical protein
MAMRRVTISAGEVSSVTTSSAPRSSRRAASSRASAAADDEDSRLRVDPAELADGGGGGEPAHAAVEDHGAEVSDLRHRDEVAGIRGAHHADVAGVELRRESDSGPAGFGNENAHRSCPSLGAARRRSTGRMGDPGARDHSHGGRVFSGATRSGQGRRAGGPRLRALLAARAPSRNPESRSTVNARVGHCFMRGSPHICPK